MIRCSALSPSLRWLLAIACAVCLISTARPTLAADPALSTISPAGFQRGTEVEVQLQGARLGDAEQLLFYSPGLSVAGIEKVDDNTIKARLAVAPDCRLGIHAVRVRTATGLSNLQTFSIGNLPEVAEKEPNNEFAEPQTVSLDVTISGVVENEDVDYFVVEAKKGERLTAEIEGIRLGRTFFDPYLAILNSERFELARSDDAALVRQDGLCSIEVPEDGRYIIQVRECSYGGNGNCVYRLHVGRFPRPKAVLPAGGKPGQTLDVTWIGDAAGDWKGQISIPETASGEYEVFPQNEHGISPSPNRIRVSPLENSLEAEPNNGPAEASPGLAPGAMNGVIAESGDIDFFKFTGSKGQVFDIRVYARQTIRSPLDAVLVVHRADGGGLASNDDSSGPDSYVRFTVPEDGEYLVSVRDHLNAGGPHYVYRIEIAPVEPSLTMTLPEKTQYIPTIMAVPRGNRGALMVAASRANWGGPLNLELRDLPAGLSYEAVKMEADRTDIPVLFSAAEDAGLAATLADVVGRPEDANLKVEGHLSQRTMLVRGQNNIDVWGHDADRMAIAVVEKVPFKIEIVQPKVPLVRNGSMNLKVVAHREEGFNAPIAIRMLYNPPGIGSSGSVTIPEGQSEAVIPLTANEGAPLKTWPIIILGQATVGNGAVEIASQMAQLEIADRLFNLTFTKAAVEQGKETQVLIELENKRPFEGTAKFELLGLPANTTTPPEGVEVTKESTQAVFQVTAEAQARAGKYNSLVGRITVVENDEPIVQTLGTGELRVDEPLPAPAAQPMPEPMPQPMPQPEQKEVAKPLSRLEKLRLERQQKLENQE